MENQHKERERETSICLNTVPTVLRFRISYKNFSQKKRERETEREKREKTSSGLPFHRLCVKKKIKERKKGPPPPPPPPPPFVLEESLYKRR